MTLILIFAIIYVTQLQQYFRSLISTRLHWQEASNIKSDSLLCWVLNKKNIVLSETLIFLCLYSSGINNWRPVKTANSTCSLPIYNCLNYGIKTRRC